jgi:integrase
MKALASHLDDYLQLRRKLGYKLVVTGILLHGFVRYCEERKATHITTDLVLRWATSPQNIGQRQRAVRFGIVRRFARHLQAIDSRTEVPDQSLLPLRHNRPTPCLYSNVQVDELIVAAGMLDERRPFKCATCSTLFGLLAVSGMRVGEALSLRFRDVDLQQGILTIPKSKGNKTRLVPLHPSAVRVLERYMKIRSALFPPSADSRFFVTGTGTALPYPTVNGWYLTVARRIGLRATGDSGGLRLYDLRHRFAIQTLVTWYKTGVDAGVHLPELATYLGHVHVSDTYWYLSAAPELLQLASIRWHGTKGGLL